VGKVADKTIQRTKMPFSPTPASKIYIYRIGLFDETLSRASIIRTGRKVQTETVDTRFEIYGCKGG